MITINIRKSEQCNGEYSLFLSFPYNADYIDIIRQQSERYWNKDTKEWEVPFKKFEYFITQFSDDEIEIISDTNEPFLKKSKVIEIPNGFAFKTNPYQYQKEGFEYGLSHDRWLLGDTMGLGKTKQSIDIAVAKKIQKGYQHCLVICGVNGLKWNWLNEIGIHSDERGYILGQRTKGKKTVIGSTKDKIYDIDHIDTLNSYFIITNVESLRNDEIVAKLGELCKNKTIQMIVADEIHKCKDPNSQQGKGFLKLQAETMIAMTGTPLMNQPLDLFIILKWLGYEKHSFYAFRQYYCEFGGYGGYQIMGYKHLDDLQEQLDEMMLRRRKEDVLDLPEKIYIDEYVEMTAKQSQLYKEIAMDIQANIDRVKAAVNPLAEMIRMRQATGYTGILSSTIQESAKLDRMIELIDEAKQDGKQVVVFSNWTQMTDVIYDKLRTEYRVNRITGQTKDADRQTIVNDFQSGKYDVLIGTIGAMGTGLTLTAGTVEIFLDHPWNRALYDQAVDRCHRVGQTNSITIYNLLTKNTIDERIWELVNKKGAMSDALIDGQWDGSKGDLVDYLLS